MTAKSKTNNAVVTGCTGAIGTALIDLLLKNGFHVYAVSRKDSPRTDNIPKNSNLTLVECDLSELQTLPAKIHVPCDFFFHLAWAGTSGAGRNDMLLQTSNISACINAVHAAHELGCTVFVGAGSQAEYGRKQKPLTPDMPAFPENGYGMAKLCAGQMAWQICDSYGMKCLWFRILSIYGENDGENTMIMSAIRQFLRKEKPSFTAGEQIWDYLYSKDAARALLMGAENAPHSAVYPLGSGNPHTLKEYICIIRDCIDDALPIGFGDIPYSEKQVMYLCADIRQLTKDTGFVPETDFISGIHQVIAAQKKKL